jgi:integrase
MASVAKRPNGKWRARYVGPDGKQHAQHFDVKADALRWLAAQVTRMRDGTWIDPRLGKRTFEEFATSWLDGQIHHRPTTARITKQRLEKHLIPVFGSRPLAAITRADVQAFVTAKSKDGLAPSTVEALYRLLAQIMLAAIEEKVLAHTPCRRVNLPQQAEKTLTIPTVEQITELHAAAPDHAKTMILVAAATGLRISEMCGLTVDRVDFLRRTITVDRQSVGNAAGKPRFGPPKTKASVRVIPVPEKLTLVIAAHLVAHPSEDVVFRSASDMPWRRESLSHEFSRWAKAAGYPFTWHSFRHFYASALIEAGQSVKVVQARLGHATAQETLDTYARLWPSDEDGTREAVKAVLLGISGTVEGQVARKPRSAG